MSSFELISSKDRVSSISRNGRIWDILPDNGRGARNCTAPKARARKWCSRGSLRRIEHCWPAVRWCHSIKNYLAMGVSLEVCQELSHQRIGANPCCSVPFGFVIICLIIWIYPRRPGSKNYLRSAVFKVDWMGVFLSLASTALLTFALQEAGTKYSWKSAPIISTFVLSFVGWICFGFWEHILSSTSSSAVPIFPLRLVQNRIVAASLAYVKVQSWKMGIANFQQKCFHYRLSIHGRHHRSSTTIPSRERQFTNQSRTSDPSSHVHSCCRLRDWRCISD